MKNRLRVVIADDEEYVRDSIRDILAPEGMVVSPAGSAAEALELIEDVSPDVVIADLRMPGEDGHTLIKGALEVRPDLPIVVLTGAGTVADAVRAFRQGVVDFLEKPVDPEHLVHRTRTAAEHGSLRTQVRHLRRAVDDLRGGVRLLGDSEAMRHLRSLVARVAPTEATVLVTGESGTGKELVAASIHQQSLRSDGPLIWLNCAALAEGLFESELFGHARGAFTGAVSQRTGHLAEAEGGTLVLDEIGTLQPASQAKLLRVLETRTYQPVGRTRPSRADVRIVAVTNEDLGQRVRDGGFRNDLLHRLAVFPIATPPLREHMEDLPALVEHLLGRLGHEVRSRKLPEPAMRVLRAHDWPGNVRELRNVLERCVILTGGAPPDAELVASIIEGPGPLGHGPSSPDLDLRAQTAAFERDLVLRALEQAQGRKRKAAELLGIDPRNLAYYLRKHDIGESRP